MLGFRVDHVPWQNFPFKDPGQRMMKTGQGFSKVYAKSHADTSYYNVPGMMNGQMSATDLTQDPGVET